MYSCALTVRNAADVVLLLVLVMAVLLPLLLLMLMLLTLLTGVRLFAAGYDQDVSLANQSDHVPARYAAIYLSRCCCCDFSYSFGRQACCTGLDVRGSRKETAELHKLCLSDNIDFRTE